MFQKGVPSRYILTAEEIFDGQKVERIWILIKQVFEIFAMHDVKQLKNPIINWLQNIVQFFDSKNQFDLSVNWKSEEFYNQFKTGLPYFYILFLYMQSSPEFLPDPQRMYELPQSRTELVENLNYVLQLQHKANIPIYLTPEDYLDRIQSSFLLLQLYYLYCRFNHVEMRLSG